MAESTVTLTVDAGIARVTLARPDVRNAFNAQMIGDLAATFAKLDGHGSVRAVVLAGDGPVFCGGADVNWMRGSLDLSYEQNVADAERMSDMFRTIDRCNKPTIARIQGAALGGGAGLACVCDIVIAESDASFGFTEVKLGIIPAVISPFAIAKIGISNARALFLTGERFSAERAKAIGLVHEVVDIDALDDAIDRVVHELRSAGPDAVAQAKALIASVREAGYDDTRSLTARAIAKQRVTPEGQEGLRAFLERRKATFVS
jgi:methylglutaconyl-CoA hydratase